MAESHIREAFEFSRMLEDDELAVSFDMVSLYTSVTIRNNRGYLHILLISYDFLAERTVLAASEIIRGLEL